MLAAENIRLNGSTRALADEHLRGSAAVGDAGGAELEALCRGWAQPATFR